MDPRPALTCYQGGCQCRARTDIDRQHVMPFASPSQVKEDVHRVFEVCGTSEGGISACGEVGPDVPLATIRAMYEAL